MKQPMNFRLSHQALVTLSLLEKKLHTSKTAVVEEALKLYAERALNRHHPIMQYAGILNEQESDALLAAIESSKHDKEIEVKW